MILLSNGEREFIKFCKGHYRNRYPFRGSWLVSFKPLFKEIYGWNPNDDKYQYVIVLFNKLFDIYMKIADDKSGSNNELRTIFSAAFFTSISRPQKRPIERAISQLCGIIQSNQVINDNGNERYIL